MTKLLKNQGLNERKAAMKEVHEMTLEEYQVHEIREITEKEGKHAADKWL